MDAKMIFSSRTKWLMKRSPLERRETGLFLAIEVVQFVDQFSPLLSYQRSPWGPSSEDPPPTDSLVWFKQAWQQHLEVVSVEGGDWIVQEKKEEKKEARKWRWLPLKKWVKLSLSSPWTRLYIETQVQALNIPLHNLFVILNHLLSIHERQERVKGGSNIMNEGRSHTLLTKQ